MDCFCGSGKSYSECCQPLHQGGDAPNALSLMRSRYSAYAMGNVDYILKTTHSENPQNKPSLAARRQQIIRFCADTDFRGLKILDFSESQLENTVTFSVSIFQNGVDCSFTEKSYFKKENGLWKYFKGEIN